MGGGGERENQYGIGDSEFTADCMSLAQSMSTYM